MGQRVKEWSKFKFNHGDIGKQILNVVGVSFFRPETCDLIMRGWRYVQSIGGRTRFCCIEWDDLWLGVRLIKLGDSWFSAKRI